MVNDLSQFDPGASELQIAWFIVDLQASLITDQKAVIELQRDMFENAMNLTREREKQIDRLMQSVYPTN
jgi:hypothetical protein